MERGAGRTARRGRSPAQTFPAESADFVRLHAAPSVSRTRSVVLGTGTLVQGDFGRWELEEALGCDRVQHFWAFLHFPLLGPGLGGPRHAPSLVVAFLSCGLGLDGANHLPVSLCPPRVPQRGCGCGCLLGTSAMAPWGRGRVKSHPIEMEMSWEAPVLSRLSCWNYCAYSRA